MKGWGPCQTGEAAGGSRVLGFICTRPHNPGASVETEGTRDVRAGTTPRKWPSAIDHTRKRHPIIVTAVTGIPRSQ